MATNRYATTARCYRNVCDAAVREIPKKLRKIRRLENDCSAAHEMARLTGIRIREIPEARMDEVTASEPDAPNPKLVATGLLRLHPSGCGGRLRAIQRLTIEARSRGTRDWLAFRSSLNLRQADPPRFLCGREDPSTAFTSDGWWPGPESNQRHRDFQSRALPTELPGLSDAWVEARTNLHYNMPYMLH